MSVSATSEIQDMDVYGIIMLMYDDQYASNNSLNSPIFTNTSNTYSTITWDSNNNMTKPTEAQIITKYDSIKSDISKLIGSIILDAKRNGDIIIPKSIETVDAKVRINDLRRAITNLTSNASRESTKVEISLTKKDKNALIIIDDNGPGINQKDYNSVFKAFYRIESSRNLSTGGLGLGLTIARDIARSHGGEIKLEKSPLGGLRATLSVPI